ncbi:MAG: phosphotransferase [Limimaricola sp.]|uniref:phosphotransferase n=1 Tax=Limimaricola sp. TaxID=2211665 RepID=UPI001D687AC4|nr:phosphotransferase [Limimaricola sp.]MBI1416507.1 phosphotransferase [Limimaricola sp.]
MADGATGLDISQARLGDYLSAHVPGFSGLRDIAKFAAGQSNPTYRVTAVSGLYVLRAKPPGALLASAHQVEREYRVMAALAGSAVPVPRVLHLATDDASPLGRAFFVMEHVAGRVFFDPALPDVAPGQRGQIYDAMNATLAALHGLDPVALGLADYGKPGNYFARQTERWAAQYAASTADPLPDMLAVIDWLGREMPPDDGQVALVHGDWRLDNLMIAPDGPQVRAVLDWELSTLGHPLADLAYQCMQWRLPHDAGMRGLGGLDRAALGLPDEAGYVVAYARRRGIGPIAGWEFYLVFAFFRLAAILAGVAARAEAGNASNPETARAYGAAVPRLAAMALEITREGALEAGDG